MSAVDAPRPRILIVDDDPIIIRTLAQILRETGEISFAKDGDTALRKVVENKIDMVLLDAEMPGMNGFDVCRRLKQAPETADVTIMFVTSHSDIASETRALELGAVDFISKPVSPPVVRARVTTHLILRRQAEMLRELALLDGLTGIPNRRRFDEVLDTEWRRAQRVGYCLTLMMIDVDHFKAYNDHYGHRAGDDCLRAVAGVLAKTAQRSSDLVARYGGEEFAIILAENDGGNDGDGAVGLADAIHRALGQAGLPHAASSTADRVTLSIGVATLRPGQGEDSAMLVSLADQALYRAKKDGRNRTATHQREAKAGPG